MHQRKALEKLVEFSLFKSRWLLAPFYVGLALTLIMLLISFVGKLVFAFKSMMQATPEQVILSTLSLIDLSLAGNLVILVIFSGYENFVSKLDTGRSEDRPDWMGKLDFSGLKMKLIGSIVAISAISLLRAFMSLTEQNFSLDEPRIRWLIVLHLTFIISGVLFAAMDWLAAQTARH